MTDVDKKRSLSQLSEVEVKRQKPLHKVNEDGPLTQDEVVYFQKEAIWRQMSIFKQKSHFLTKDLNKYQQEFQINQSKLIILDSWYEQIVNLFSNAMDDSNLNDTLLLKATDVSDIGELLEKRRVQLLKILSPILDNLKGNSSFEAKELVSKLELLNSELVSVKSTNETLKKAKASLEQKIEMLQHEILSLVKDKDRQSSKTLKRVDVSMKKEPETNGSEQVEETNGHIKQEPDIPVKSPIDEKPVIDDEELNKMKAELDELKSTNTLLSLQLEEVNEKYHKSQQEVIQLDNRISHLKESDLADNVYYMNVVKNNRSLQDQIGKLNKLNDSNISRLKELEAKQNNVIESIDKEISDENQSLKEQLHKTESDLVRIRTARDELLAKITILKSQVENQKTNEEVHKMNQILQQRLQQLEATGNEIECNNSTYTELSKEELINRITSLSGEIKEIESAFKETREIALKKLENAIDQEHLVKKLSIEKTKADQKYFASMRLKDSIQAENKVLKAQIAKSQDIIKNLNDLEKSYTNKIEILSNTVNDYKSIKENSLHENSKLEDSTKSLQNIKLSLEAEVKKYSRTLEEKNNKLHELNVEVGQQKIAINKLEKNLRSTESLLRKYKDNNTSLILQEDEQQLEALRSIAKCSVCSKNWKDTAITVCGHVFCHNCTQERLAARLRRCPSCNKGFSSNDLLSIHL